MNDSEFLQITSTSTSLQILIPDRAEKDDLHRLRLFAQWLEENQLTWYQPNLTTYRDYLLQEYTGRDQKPLLPSSTKAHLATIRGRYRAILRDNHTRDFLYSMAQEQATPADKKAFVDEMITRIQNEIDPENASVHTISRQDRPDDEHIRLSSSQANRLLTMPDIYTLMGLRDAAIIAMMLCTGIREAELCALDVDDLRQRLGGELALHIRLGKGRKERLIPYGELEWVLAIVDSWLTNAGITYGALLRGFYKGGKHIRKTRLTVRAVNQILGRYPIMVDGKLQKINPHNLRRTYARRLYEAGVDLLAIRDNLGHADSRTTLKYIGTMDVDARKPPAIYSFDVSQLK